ncbi:adenosylcobyric acid synthase (glutamine-hydrolysing) [Roseinatronobacter monicus]|uniref:Cobyric acid synthase n=2 Tax=Roseinatronobacter monicus TaxID=393481 RepID=A0A543KHG8_9RHOB|nr:adenosylcobyric acid synthase (glutamine-hydrolysing) [Roseinatronobacter monicus]
MSFCAAPSGENGVRAGCAQAPLALLFCRVLGQGRAEWQLMARRMVVLMTAVMIQGCGSNVGKSMLVAGLCRAARRRGLRVAPFKPQNMSNNAAVTADGGEIGRAQALQALACGLAPITDMNPVLLKPESERGAQVIVQGKRLTTAMARDYARLKPQLMGAVLDSFQRLRAAHDLVIIEGAGSPAEVNLRAGDIANMGFARAADVPVVLVGDIDRGGVIAQLIGTQAVIDADDAAMVVGFLINKFRGDPQLFDDGYQLISQRTGWRGFGVVPWFDRAHLLPAEDALDLASGPSGGGTKIACLAFSRIANFDDLDPLAAEENVDLVIVRAGEAIPGDARLVILPGSKSTRGDLAFLRAQGWDIDLQAHIRRGGHVLGICGGYQMLGQVVRDSEGIEGEAGDTAGLGILDVETTMSPDKRLTRVAAQHVATGLEVMGYEIHIGRTIGPDRARPFATVNGESEGAISANGQITGTYLHGLFASDMFRAQFLAGLDIAASGMVHGAVIEQALDALADHVEAHIDVAGILALSR